MAIRIGNEKLTDSRLFTSPEYNCLKKAYGWLIHSQWHPISHKITILPDGRMIRKTTQISMFGPTQRWTTYYTREGYEIIGENDREEKKYWENN